MRRLPDCHVLSRSEAVHGPFEGCPKLDDDIGVKVFCLLAGILTVAVILSSGGCTNPSQQSQPYHYQPSAIISPSPSPEPGHIPMGGWGIPPRGN